ncbi:MAG: DUF86 domain-containing protein [Saprospiraceae bacterium]
MPDKFGDKIRLQHTLDAIETIEGYITVADFQAFSDNLMMQDACIRQLQVIGESCRNVSPELREKYPEVPWSQIVGLRIIVIHQYFGVDIRVIWEVIQSDLPVFKVQVKRIVEELK